MNFKKIVTFYPAWDKRDANPNKDYGIHNVEITFFLQKGKRAVSFNFGTDWYLPETVKEYKEKGLPGRCSPHNLRGREECGVRGNQICYHSPKRMFKEQDSYTSECQITKGKCYSDGSYCYASDKQDILIREGSEGVWKLLEEYWKEVFEKEKVAQ